MKGNNEKPKRIVGNIQPNIQPQPIGGVPVFTPNEIKPNIAIGGVLGIRPAESPQDIQPQPFGEVPSFGGIKPNLKPQEPPKPMEIQKPKEMKPEGIPIFRPFESSRPQQFGGIPVFGEIKPNIKPQEPPKPMEIKQPVIQPFQPQQGEYQQPQPIQLPGTQPFVGSPRKPQPIHLGDSSNSPKVVPVGQQERKPPQPQTPQNPQVGMGNLNERNGPPPINIGPDFLPRVENPTVSFLNQLTEQFNNILLQVHEITVERDRYKMHCEESMKYNGGIEQMKERDKRESQMRRELQFQQQYIEELQLQLVEMQQMQPERDIYIQQAEQLQQELGKYQSAFNQVNEMLMKKQQENEILKNEIQRREQVIQQLQQHDNQILHYELQQRESTIQELTGIIAQMRERIEELEITNETHQMMRNDGSEQTVALQQELEDAKVKLSQVEMERDMYKEHGEDGVIQLFIMKNNYFNCQRDMEAPSELTHVECTEHPDEIGKYIVTVTIKDPRVKYVLLHDSQQLRNNRYLQGKVVRNGTVQFVVPRGNYHICGYSEESLINLTCHSLQLE